MPLNGNEWDDLSPEEQQARLAETIRTSTGAAPSGQPALTPISSLINIPSGPPDTSFTGALRHGLHGAVQGLGHTVSVLGAPETGAEIAGSIDDAPNYQSTAEPIGQAIHDGRWADLAEYIPRAIVEQAPDIAGGTAAGLVGSLGGPIGTAAGVAAYTGARTLGDNTLDSATRNDHVTPTWGDVASGAAGSALEAVPAAVFGPGAGRALAGATGGLARAAGGYVGEMASAIAAATPAERLAAAYSLAHATGVDDMVTTTRQRSRIATMLRLLGYGE